MFSKEVMEMLRHVITSWQVIVTTVALVLYLNFVFYVSRARRFPRPSKKISFKRKRKTETIMDTGPVTSSSSDNINDELGLEED